MPSSPTSFNWSWYSSHSSFLSSRSFSRTCCLGRSNIICSVFCWLAHRPFPVHKYHPSSQYFVAVEDVGTLRWSSSFGAPPNRRGRFPACPSEGNGYFAFPSGPTLSCRLKDRIFFTSCGNTFRMHNDRQLGSREWIRPLTVCEQYVKHHSSYFGENRPVSWTHLMSHRWPDALWKPALGWCQDLYCRPICKGWFTHPLLLLLLVRRGGTLLLRIRHGGGR